MEQFNTAELVAYSGQVILKTLKRELMEIVEAFCSPNDEISFKKLIKQKLNNSYNSIRYKAMQIEQNDQVFVDFLKDLEISSRHGRYTKY